MDSSTLIIWMNPFVKRIHLLREGARLILFYDFNIYWCIFQAKNEDPDETPHDAVSLLGMHCMPMSRL